MEELILYNYFRSSTSYRVRIALHFKNLSFQYQPVHLLKDGGEQHSDFFKNLNPMSEVPTLIHEGMTLSQSMAIIEYLDEAFPHPFLFPKELQKRARVRQFCENINSFMHPLSNLKVLQYLEKILGLDEGKKNEWVQNWLLKGFEAAENLIKRTHGDFCFGDQITAADLFLVPQIFSSQRFKMDLSNFPVLRKINENCLSEECFQKAHPFRQVDTPSESKQSPIYP